MDFSSLVTYVYNGDVHAGGRIPAGYFLDNVYDEKTLKSLYNPDTFSTSLLIISFLRQEYWKKMSWETYLSQNI